MKPLEKYIFNKNNKRDDKWTTFLGKKIQYDMNNNLVNKTA